MKKNIYTFTCILIRRPGHEHAQKNKDACAPLLEEEDK